MMTATALEAATNPVRRERKPLTTLGVLGGGRSGNDMRLLAAATEVGKAIASSGIRLVYRGGSHGLVAAAAHAAASHGGEVVAIIRASQVAPALLPSAPGRTVLVADAAAQEKGLQSLAQAYVALPGGIGTLSDIARILGSSIQPDQHRPVLLADFGGYWRSLLRLFDHFIDAAFADGAWLDQLIVTEEVHSVVPLLQRATYFQDELGPDELQGLGSAGALGCRGAARFGAQESGDAVVVLNGATRAPRHG